MFGRVELESVYVQLPVIQGTKPVFRAFTVSNGTTLSLLNMIPNAEWRARLWESSHGPAVEETFD